MSPEEKKAKKIGESFAEFEEQISRREELMCIDLLFKGSIVVKGEGIEDKIEYGNCSRNYSYSIMDSTKCRYFR